MRASQHADGPTKISCPLPRGQADLGPPGRLQMLAYLSTKYTTAHGGNDWPLQP